MGFAVVVVGGGGVVLNSQTNTSAVNICTIVTLTWAGGRSLQVISVVMSELSVAVCVVFWFGGVRSGAPHPVQIKLMVVRVHGLSVRRALIIFVLAVRRLSAVIAHIRHRGLGESRGVLGVRVATHRSWKIGQNASNFLLIGLSGAHGNKNKPPRREKSPLVESSLRQSAEQKWFGRTGL